MSRVVAVAQTVRIVFHRIQGRGHTVQRGDDGRVEPAEPHAASDRTHDASE